jgi:zona occludens toxin (predicted ATPase)
MIISFVGTPGSGKSYDAVRKIYDNLRMGRRVYTNIEGMDGQEQQEILKMSLGLGDYDFKKLFHWVSDKEIENFWEYVKDGSLIVIDEVHKRFNCRDWQTQKNLNFANWCSRHRHHGFDLVLVTQDIDKVEKQVRSLIEWSYVYRKVNFLGSMVQKQYLVYSYSGDDVSGKPLSTVRRTYESMIFRFYKSFSTDQQKEVVFMTHVNILKHPVFFAIPIVIAFTIYMFFAKSSYATGDLFGSKKVATRERATKKPLLVPAREIPAVVQVADGKQLPTSAAPARVPLPVQGNMSTAQAVPPVVSGYVNMGSKTLVLLTDNSTVVVRGSLRPRIGSLPPKS